VGQEALRLRMSALHGREDPLLDSGRFLRLLRQANDAEIADVRKVGEDDYEIAARRGGATPPPPTPTAAPAPAGVTVEAEPEAAPVFAGEAEPTAGEPAGTARENALRYGVRFRRGSRGGLRTAEYPLVGVVQVDEPPAAAQAPAAQVPAIPAAESAGTEEAAAKPERPRRTSRKKAGTTRAAKAKAAKPAPAEASAPEGGAAAAGPAKRPRARTRKKAE
jgi:hypothetical protein